MSGGAEFNTNLGPIFNGLINFYILSQLEYNAEQPYRQTQLLLAAGHHHPGVFSSAIVLSQTGPKPIVENAGGFICGTDGAELQLTAGEHGRVFVVSERIYVRC
ncbi:MAG TPA: hypothetical protein VLG09_05120 [Candidatus Saccharimonadales bacterium]|nr:hypothetical protein [Candidatus Saccharimonadales bacterium]